MMMPDNSIPDWVMKKTEGLVREYLDESFAGIDLAFGPILVKSVYDDYYDEEYLQVRVVFDGDFDLLDSNLTLGLRSYMRPHLREMRVATVPGYSFIEKSELEEILRGTYYESE